MRFKAKVVIPFQGKTPDGEDKIFEAGEAVTEADLDPDSFEAALTDGWIEPVGEDGGDLEIEL
jgi:hypothetical protein